MNKLKIIIILLLFTCCCGDTELLDHGLNGNVKMLTEYNITIKYDSLNSPIRDTLSVTKKYYNDRGQIIERNQNIIFPDEIIKMDITYEYNGCNRLQKERVKMSFDSIATEVNYIYKNSVVEKTIAESTRDSIYFKQIGLNQYDANKKLTESSISQIFINLKTVDTIQNSLQIDKYDEDRFLTDSEFKFYKKPNKNYRSEFIYDGDELITINDFDRSDSLTLMIRFEYKTDTLSNWVVRKSFENNKLNTIKIRKITYEK